MGSYYSGAGDGQCAAIQASDGDRCPNGVYGSNDCCGTHKRADDVDYAPEQDDDPWFRCPGCGWQPASYGGPGTAPACSECGVEFPVGADRWRDTQATEVDLDAE